MIYPVKDSHSHLKEYVHSDHAWSEEQHKASDEVKWVNITRTLHADTLEHMDLIDGRTGRPSVTANSTTSTNSTTDAGTTTPSGDAGATDAAALFQRKWHYPFHSFSQIYKVKDSSPYIKPYDQRDHSWTDNEYDAADEVGWLSQTRTLNQDYLENLEPTAQYHLVGGRTGVAETNEDQD